MSSEHAKAKRTTTESDAGVLQQRQRVRSEDDGQRIVHFDARCEGMEAGDAAAIRNQGVCVWFGNRRREARSCIRAYQHPQ